MNVSAVVATECRTATGVLVTNMPCPRQGWNIQRVKSHAIARQDTQASHILDQCPFVDLRAADKQRIVMGEAGGRDTRAIGRQFFSLQSSFEKSCGGVVPNNGLPAVSNRSAVSPILSPASPSEFLLSACWRN